MKTSNVVRLTEDSAKTIEMIRDVIQKKMNVKASYVSIIEAGLKLYYEQIQKTFDIEKR